MGDTQHFCLRWNNYQSSITSAFENLRDDEDFVDVTLACDGRSLKAHRVVLSACSPYFRELLKVCYQFLISCNTNVNIDWLWMYLIAHWNSFNYCMCTHCMYCMQKKMGVGTDRILCVFTRSLAQKARLNTIFIRCILCALCIVLRLI